MAQWRYLLAHADALHVDITPTVNALKEGILQASAAFCHASYQKGVAQNKLRELPQNPTTHYPPTFLALNSPEDPHALLATAITSLSNTRDTIEGFLATLLSLFVHHPSLRDSSQDLLDFVNDEHLCTVAEAQTADGNSFIQDVCARLLELFSPPA